jgi:hypothetical protein
MAMGLKMEFAEAAVGIGVGDTTAIGDTAGLKLAALA